MATTLIFESSLFPITFLLSSLPEGKYFSLFPIIILSALMLLLVLFYVQEQLCSVPP